VQLRSQNRLQIGRWTHHKAAGGAFPTTSGIAILSNFDDSVRLQSAYTSTTAMTAFQLGSGALMVGVWWTGLDRMLVVFTQ
jgi:hypothetical protein